MSKYHIGTDGSDNFAVNSGSIIEFGGSSLDVNAFAEKFECNAEDALAAMVVLLNKGKAKLRLNRTQDEKVFQQVQKEESWREAADSHDAFVEAAKDYHANQKRKDKLTYPKVGYDFPHMLAAQDFQEKICQDLRLDDTEIVVKSGVVTVVFHNITDPEMGAIDRYYSADKAVKAIVGTLDKTATMATDGVHYGATKIVAPAIQVGARAGASIFKTILTVGAKSASTLITAGTQGVRSAAHEIRHDEDVLRAGRDLLDAKDSIMRGVAGFNGGVGGGHIMD